MRTDFGSVAEARSHHHHHPLQSLAQSVPKLGEARHIAWNATIQVALRLILSYIF